MKTAACEDVNQFGKPKGYNFLKIISDALNLDGNDNRIEGVNEMKGVKVQIVRIICKDQPGLVECKFRDACGAEFVIEEKIPIVTKDDLNEIALYSRDGAITCESIKEWTDEDDRRLVTIDINKPLAIETIDSVTALMSFAKT